MPKIKYIDKNFRPLQRILIGDANEIIEEYQAQGYSLTLRQLYYQFVSRNLLPIEWFDATVGSTNNDKSYKKLGEAISNGREAGLIDWDAIVDRTRPTYGLDTWASSQESLEEAAQTFRLDKWLEQDHRVYVWVEKEALADVIAQACTDEDIQVDYKACKGYMSSSAIWKSAIAVQWTHKAGQIPVFLHLGDHDPSGIDMTRDNVGRISLYSGLKPGQFIFKRIALNMDQVREYNPPPNPTKVKDSRANGYIANYGYDSWELDALEPTVLVDLIQTEIRKFRDTDKWDEMVQQEAEQKKELLDLADGWGDDD